MKMKFLSLQSIWTNSLDSFKRFPETLIASFVAATLWLLVSEGTLAESNTNIVAIMVVMLGISLFFAIATYAEAKKLSLAKRSFLDAGPVALLVALYCSHYYQSSLVFTWRWAEFFVAAHLVVAFLPYLKASDEGFWEFNQRLFQRFLFSAFFSLALFLGIVVAMYAIHFLFDFRFEHKTYSRVAIFCGLVFNTWFFLGGIPNPLPRKEHPEAFSRNLDLFTKRLLIPLVTVYLVILYAYMLKIGFEWTWPKGTVGYLVSAFSLLGIFALLLTHPIQQTTENRWVKVYSRGFYFALFPLVILLLMGATTRIQAYGITERRYLLMALGLWLAGIAAYFTVSKKRDIRVIPVSLCLAILVTTMGPWNAYEVSYHAQLGRLTRLLSDNGILKDGKVKLLSKQQAAALPRDSRREIANILDYLNEVHSGRGLESWFSEGLASKIKEQKEERFEIFPWRGYQVSDPMMKEMGLEYGYSSYAATQTYTVDAFAKLPEGMLVEASGYEAALPFHLTWYSDSLPESAQWRGSKVVLGLKSKNSILNLELGGETVVIPLAPLMRTDDVHRSYSQLRLDAKGSKVIARVYVDRLTWKENKTTGTEVEHVSGLLFLRRTK